MKALRILSRNIRDAFYSVFRNFSLSLASISCITITLLVVTISIILTYNVNNFSSLVEKDITIVTFLNVDIDEEGRNNVRKEIEKLPNIESIEYQDKVDITKDMMKSSETFKNIMGSWSNEENPIQSTYLVKVKDIEKIADTAKKIKKIDGVDALKYGEGWLTNGICICIIKKISLGIVVALIVVTAFINIKYRLK